MRRAASVGIRVVCGASMTALLVVVGTVPSFGQRAPKPALTPGAASPTASLQTLCERGHAVRAHRLSVSTRTHVLDAYRVPERARDGYTVDHLVPVALGGTDAVANLWPVTRRDARSKRAVVARVVARLCAGGVDLATAQHAFVADWRTALATATTTTTSTSTTTPPAPTTIAEVPETTPETAPPITAEEVPLHSPYVPPPTLAWPELPPMGSTTPAQPVHNPVYPTTPTYSPPQ